MSISQLIPAGLSPTAAQTETLLELAYLVTAVDGRLADEELAAFKALAARLQGKDATTEAELDEILERFGHNVDWDEIEPRVIELAKILPKDLHAVAYQLALGLAFVDNEPSEEEDRLHKVLADALELTAETRASLSRQVSLDGGKATAESS